MVEIFGLILGKGNENKGRDNLRRGRDRFGNVDSLVIIGHRPQVSPGSE